MPLTQSASKDAFKDNLHAELSAGKPQRQALAIAYATQRRNRYAAGGFTPDSFSRGAMHSIMRAGLIHSPVAGRTDHIPARVPSGSYVLPADHVSGLGQGNTLNGGKVLDRMFKTRTSTTIPRPPAPMRFADGGTAADNGVDIIVAGGEYLLHPEQIREMGGGDLNHGHEALDRWVNEARKAHVATLKRLPGPKS